MNNLDNINKYRYLHPSDKQLVITDSGDLKALVFEDVINHILEKTPLTSPSEVSVFDSLKSFGLTRKYIIYAEFILEEGLDGFLKEVSGGDDRYFLHRYKWEWEINAVFEVRIQNPEDFVEMDYSINYLETKNGIKNPIKLDYRSEEILGNRLSSKYLSENQSFLVRDCIEKPSNTDIFTLVLEPFDIDGIYDNILSLSINDQEKGFIPIKAKNQYIQSISLDYSNSGNKRVQKSMEFPNMGSPAELYLPETLKLKTHNKDGTPIEMNNYYLVGEPEEMKVGENIIPIDEENGEDFDFVKRINVILNLKATRKNIMAVNLLKIEIGKTFKSLDIPITQMVSTYNQDGLYREIRSVYDETEINLPLDYPDYYKYLQQNNLERLNNGRLPGSFWTMKSLYPEFQHPGRLVMSHSKIDATGTYFADQVQTLGLSTNVLNTATTSVIVENVPDKDLYGNGIVMNPVNSGGNGSYTGLQIYYGKSKDTGDFAIFGNQTTATATTSVTSNATTSSSARQGERTEQQNVTEWIGIIMKAGLTI